MKAGGRAVDKAAVGPAAVIDRLRTQVYRRSPLFHLEPLAQRQFGSENTKRPPANQTRLKSLML